METWVIVIWASLGLIAGMAVVLIFMGGATRWKEHDYYETPREIIDDLYPDRKK